MITLLKNLLKIFKFNDRLRKKEKNCIIIKKENSRIYLRILTKPPDFMSSQGLR